MPMTDTDQTMHSQRRITAGTALWARSLALVLAIGGAVPTALAQDELTVGGRFEMEEVVEEAVEEQVAEVVEENVEDDTQEQVEESIADAVTEQVEDRIADAQELSVGGRTEITVEESVEEQVEDALEDDISAGVEDAIEDAVEATVAENLENEVGQDIEDSIEETIADNVEVSVQDTVEEAVESEIENTVVENIEESVETEVEESVAEAVEQDLEENVEESVAEIVEDNAEEAVEVALEDSVSTQLEGSVEENLEVAAVTAVEGRIENEIDSVIEDIESALDVDERRIRRGQWLVMAEPDVFEELADEGYIFDAITDLPGMGMRLAEVAAPASFDISTARQGVFDVVGSDRAQVDLNHFYTAGTPDSTHSEGGVAPRDAIAFPADTADLDLKIGMLDSRVDTAHPSLAAANIEARSFVAQGADEPAFHGTAVASIIAADGELQGLAPQTQLYAASVFEDDTERGEIASTVSLVRALDWLISSGVDAVNISLAGPPNRLLEAALSRVSERDVMVLAAAGNGGPMAEPMYPAAYESVVAVTAVDTGGRVFRLANRGDYLDLAAPGVDLRHAQAGGGYVASSGTSFAVPFAVTAAARLKHVAPNEDVIAQLFDGAQDLGPPGRDEIYGHGLLNPQ